MLIPLPPSPMGTSVTARMVAIEGPRGVGKSTIAARVSSALGCVAVAGDTDSDPEPGTASGDWRVAFETRVRRLRLLSDMCDDAEHAPVFVVDGYTRAACSTHADEYDRPMCAVERLMIDHRPSLRTPLTICLTASVDTLARRLRGKDKARPEDVALAADPKRLRRMVEYHGPYGACPAPGTVVHTEDRTPDQVLAQVLNILALHHIGGSPGEPRVRLPIPA